MSERLTVAEVVGVYGIKGWIKVRLLVEDAKTLTEFEGLVMAPGPRMNPNGLSGEIKSSEIKLSTVRPQGKGFVAHLVGVDDRNAAEKLVGCVLTASAEQLPPTEVDEDYWRDLVGLRVHCVENAHESCLGVVDYLLDTGANDVLVIKPSDDSVDDKERLVPWVLGDVVTKVDLVARELWLDWYVDE